MVDGFIKMTDATDTDEDIAEPTAPAQPVIPVLVSQPDDQVLGHSTNFVNELKRSDFKLGLTINGKNNHISNLTISLYVCR